MSEGIMNTIKSYNIGNVPLVTYIMMGATGISLAGITAYEALSGNNADQSMVSQLPLFNNAANVSNTEEETGIVGGGKRKSSYTKRRHLHKKNKTHSRK
jgi:hypothetical protein